MSTLVPFIAVAIALIAIFAAYWIGRDSGEKAGFAAQQNVTEQLTQNNVQLKMEVQRLRRERDVYAERAQRGGYTE